MMPEKINGCLSVGTAYTVKNNNSKGEDFMKLVAEESEKLSGYDCDNEEINEEELEETLEQRKFDDGFCEPSDEEIRRYRAAQKLKAEKLRMYAKNLAESGMKRKINEQENMRRYINKTTDGLYYPVKVNPRIIKSGRLYRNCGIIF